MDKLLLAFALALPTLASSQGLPKGVYRGNELNFLLCYLTVTDSTAEVEYFNKKGGEIFGHLPPTRVLLTQKNSPLYQSMDGIIRVYKRTGYLMVEKKKYANVKVRLMESGMAQLIDYRRRNILFKNRLRSEKPRSSSSEPD
ncbi:hypothetical protein [Fibrella aestuarina]|uniref:hypothetical protein n=1 Tax=Fibrella aestuarina TaxID=651143 RepID=UPI00059E86E4|nr:hypothetical protein [Fibrella aestuarina]